MWLSWLEHHPIDQKVMGLTPGQGIYPSCRFDPLPGHVPEGNQSMFLSHISLSLSAKKNNPWVRITKKENKVSIRFSDMEVLGDLLENYGKSKIAAG